MTDQSTEIFIKAKSYQIFLFSSEIKMISNIRTFFFILINKPRDMMDLLLL